MTFFACVDDTNQVSEDNEDNNCTPSPALVDLSRPDLPSRTYQIFPLQQH